MASYAALLVDTFPMLWSAEASLSSCETKNGSPGLVLRRKLWRTHVAFTQVSALAWHDGTFSTAEQEYQMYPRLPTFPMKACSWRPFSSQGAEYLERVSSGHIGGGRLHLPRRCEAGVHGALLLAREHPLGDQGFLESPAKRTVCQGPSITWPPITAEVYDLESIFYIYNCQKDNRKYPFVVIEEWPRLVRGLDHHMLPINRPHTVWKVPMMEELDSNPPPVVLGGDWHNFSHQGIPNCPCHIHHYLTDRVVPNIVIEGSGAEWVPCGKISVKTNIQTTYTSIFIKGKIKKSIL